MQMSSEKASLLFLLAATMISSIAIIDNQQILLTFKSTNNRSIANEGVIFPHKQNAW